MRLLAVCFLVFCSTVAFGQQVEAVVFEGVKRLKPNFLELYTTPALGLPADSTAAQRDCQVLRQLPAVYHAEVHWEERNGTFTQVFSIQEVFTLVPYLYVGQGGASTSRTLQLGVAEFNAFGRGVWLSADYQFKELHSLSLHTRVPRVFGRPWNAELTLKHWNTVEPLYFTEEGIRYHYRNRLVQVGLEREFKFQTHVGMRLAVFDETYALFEQTDFPLAPKQESFEKGLVQAYVRDRRVQHHWFYLNGIETIGRVTSVATRNLPEEHFLQGDFILHYYRQKRRRWNTAARLMAGLATNNTSPYAPYVIDSQRNVRGAGDRTARGTAGLFATVEWRWTALDKPNWAVQCVGYSDAGWLRTAGVDGMNDLPEWYTGAGIRVHAKAFFNAVLRADYGISPLNQSQGLTFGLGQFF